MIEYVHKFATPRMRFHRIIVDGESYNLTIQAVGARITRGCVTQWPHRAELVREADLDRVWTSQVSRSASVVSCLRMAGIVN